MEVNNLLWDDLDYWAGRAFFGKDISRSLMMPDRNNLHVERWEPSENHFQAIQIIEHEKIATWYAAGQWYATYPVPDSTTYDAVSAYIDVSDDDSSQGPTLQIAALRALVRAKFGDTVPDDPKA